MNLVEKYVGNITSESELGKYGCMVLICDTDCYGRKEKQVELVVSSEDYNMIKSKGFYLC